VKVIVDANIWISVLLARGKDTTVTRAVQGAMSWPFQLIVPQETISEITHSIAKSDYLATRIAKSEIAHLLTRVAQIAMVPPILQNEQTRRARDPGDDYLIAYGLVYDCDYLVTGDGDLLVLRRLRNMQIVTAAQFISQPPTVT
jgi:putative PIN family toxin of toxin-antitoxin system